ncbi:hypothetical protein A0H81_02560 [Grifola frondosa]|uniref:FAD/NAD(P)-binding domain-containing protein n=1 Tax=Grifola frondosa TaxID=5627 RepID=A0A1C7MKN9_GRIFR|nr:hypothetical protein A0H81_02560 [Grifola frondosa]
MKPGILLPIPSNRNLQSSCENCSTRDRLHPDFDISFVPTHNVSLCDFGAHIVVQDTIDKAQSTSPLLPIILPGEDGLLRLRPICIVGAGVAGLYACAGAVQVEARSRLVTLHSPIGVTSEIVAFATFASGSRLEGFVPHVKDSASRRHPAVVKFLTRRTTASLILARMLHNVDEPYLAIVLNALHTKLAGCKHTRRLRLICIDRKFIYWSSHLQCFRPDC